MGEKNKACSVLFLPLIPAHPLLDISAIRPIKSTQVETRDYASSDSLAPSYMRTKQWQVSDACWPNGYSRVTTRYFWKELYDNTAAYLVCTALKEIIQWREDITMIYTLSQRQPVLNCAISIFIRCAIILTKNIYDHSWSCSIPLR